MRGRSQASITLWLVNPLGKKTLIKLAGITETAAHMQEACSRSRPSYTRRHPRLSHLLHWHMCTYVCA